MPKFMKKLNNISRSQAVYRQSRVGKSDLQSLHFAFVLVICKKPGLSQEEIAKELCINKSTAARNLMLLEEKGYIERKQLPNDKRQFAVFPTEKMLSAFPAISKASQEWMVYLSEGIPETELEIFHSVLVRMENRAREIIERGEQSK